MSSPRYEVCDCCSLPGRKLYFAVTFFDVSGMTKPVKVAPLLIGAGTMLTSMVAAGFLLGYAVDAWLDIRPVFMMLFGGLGLVGGFMKAYQLLSRFG